MTGTATKLGTAAGWLAAAMMAVGCGSSSSNRPPPTNAAIEAAPVDDNAAGLTEHHRFHHHGGLAMFVAMSAETLGVPPERLPAIDKVRAELRTALEPARAADRQLLSTLADALVAPTFDSAAVDSAVARVVEASASAQEGCANAMNELHVVLTPAERAALADKVEAHWAVWQQENAGPAQAKDQIPSPLEPLADELGLDEAQVAKIRAGLTDERQGGAPLDREVMVQHVRAFSEAFRSPAFDARTLPTSAAANPHLVGWGAAHLARVIEVMRPVLTPEQRATLAQRLREHAGHEPVAEGRS
ncbi:MAG TPA: periplasmic heavy metal sensor [Polyangia bacterium]|nr:periplasmic heavy metal sensor [Polyangia bacterium]